MKIAWVHRLGALGLYILAATTDLFIEDLFSTFESLLLAILVLGFCCISLTIEESKKE